MAEWLKDAAAKIKKRNAEFRHKKLDKGDRIELLEPLRDAQSGDCGVILNISPDRVCTILMDGRKFPWQMYPNKFRVLGSSGVQTSLI